MPRRHRCALMIPADQEPLCLKAMPATRVRSTLFRCSPSLIPTAHWAGSGCVVCLACQCRSQIVHAELHSLQLHPPCAWTKAALLLRLVTADDEPRAPDGEVTLLESAALRPACRQRMVGKRNLIMCLGLQWLLKTFKDTLGCHCSIHGTLPEALQLGSSAQCEQLLRARGSGHAGIASGPQTICGWPEL